MQKKIKDRDIEVSYHGRYHWGADQDFWRNPVLSPTAKLIWILLRSAATMPDGVKINVLTRWAKRHRAGIIKDINELIRQGYVLRKFEKRQGAIISRIKYILYDVPNPKCLENSDFARSRKNGLRVTESVMSTQVKPKIVKTKQVKSSSPSPPQAGGEEEKDITINQLPPQFAALDQRTLARLERACRAKSLDLTEQTKALCLEYSQTGVEMRRPAGALMAKIKEGGVDRPEELVEAAKEAKVKLEKERKRIRDAHELAEIPRFMRN